MPPPLASCLCVGFILWLFRRDSKEAGPASFGLWVAFVWVVIAASRPLGYWLASGTEASEITDVSEGSFVDRNAYLFLIITGLFVLCRRRNDWHSFIRNGRWLWVLYAYFLISVVWAPNTFIAFKRWFKDLGDVVIILIILTENSPVNALRWIFVRSAYVLIPVSVLFIKYYPTLGRYFHRWTYTTGFSGVTTNKNSLGLLALLCGLFLLWQIVDVYRFHNLKRTLRERWPDVLVLGMCLWLLWIAESATSSFCFMLGIGIFFATRVRLVKANLGKLSWILVGVGLLMWAFTVNSYFRELVTGVLGRDSTLTDRTAIWEGALTLETNPLIGSGFASTWLTPKGLALVEQFGGNGTLVHSHNGYLETYLNSGWIGVSLLLAVLLAGGRSATRQLRAGTVVGHLFIALFLIGLFYNYTEVTFDRGNVMGTILWLLPLFPFALTDQFKNEERTEPAMAENYSHRSALTSS